MAAAPTETVMLKRLPVCTLILTAALSRRVHAAIGHGLAGQACGCPITYR
ncbi:MAG: hypothetical protein Q8R72_02420 [Hylemonella sp.]|nr:hypothetical protein [Hylemonella sp.]